MAPKQQKQKLSGEERSLESGLLAMERRYREQMKEVSAILCRHAVARHPCLEFLKGAGFTKTSDVMQMAKSRETKAREKGQQTRANAAAEQQQAVAAQDAIPAKYTTLGALVYSWLVERIVPKIDPVVLSYGNLTSSFSKEDKAPAKQRELVRIVEFLSGKSPALPLTGPLATVGGLVEELKVGVKTRGRLSRAFKFPVDWYQDGIFKIVGSNATGIKVQQRFTGETVTIPYGDFKKNPKAATETFVNNNWSEQLCEIAFGSSDNMKPLNISSYFRNHTVKKRTASSSVASSPASVASKRSRKSCSSP